LKIKKLDYYYIKMLEKISKILTMTVLKKYAQY
jgi:hypothetical protein